MTLLAKPVVPGRYWILKENNVKVGAIVAAAAHGFAVKIRDSVFACDTIDAIASAAAVEFGPGVPASVSTAVCQIYGYPTSHVPCDSVYNAVTKRPLWTKEANSTCWYVAGWWKVKKRKHWTTVFCPRDIVLDRYPCMGPFQTKEEANDKFKHNRY